LLVSHEHDVEAWVAGDDLVAVTTQVAHERETTYVVIGRPRRRTPPLGRLAHQRCRCS
jgi:hypothetical protein